MSHGTQDSLLDFSRKNSAVLGSARKSTITIVYAIGMNLRRHRHRLSFATMGAVGRCIILSAVFAGMLLIPAVDFSRPGQRLLIAGGFLMQFMVQGSLGSGAGAFERTFAG